MKEEQMPLERGIFCERRPSHESSLQIDKTGDDSDITTNTTAAVSVAATLQQRVQHFQNSSMSINDDPIAQTVQELWLTSPGMGIQELFLKVNERLGGAAGDYPPTALKRRIRIVKQGLPYQHVNGSKSDGNNNHESNSNLDAFVQSKLEDRQSLRAQKRYKDADRIAAGLHAMEIMVEDTTKTWHVGVGATYQLEPTTTTKIFLEPTTASTSSKSSNETNTKNSNICHLCGQSFASRNLIFRHLRDPAISAGSCGTSIFASNQTVAPPPSVVEKEHRQELLQQAKQTKKSRKSGNTQVHDPKDNSLWVGDLPLVWTRHGGNYQRLRLLLRAYLPRSVPPPWIKMVKRKAYKSTSTIANTTAAHDAADDDDNIPTYLGYAIIVFRDAQEAALVHHALEGQEISANYAVDDFKKEDHDASATTTIHADTKNIPKPFWAASTPTFIIKVRAVEHNATIKKKSKQEQPSSTEKATSSHKEATLGQDPPLVDQLRPLSTEELQARTKKLLMAKDADANANANAPHDLMNSSSANDECRPSSVRENEPSLPSLFSVLAVASSEEQQHEFALEQAVKAYQQQHATNDNGSSWPRPMRYHKGRLVPLPLITALLDILKTLRWAVPNHRHGLTSERYLVLLTKVKRDLHYSDLREACRALMDWADPHYFYSGIAVTKNFCGSPHVDGCDQTYQYAVSLGDFDYTRGGQLCVEGGCDGDFLLATGTSTSDFVNVVETRNRIARVDGRHVHWVRTFGQGQESPGGKGDRYSLIFYDTSDRNVTPVISSGVDVEYLERPRKEE
jgi:hypothetical protein